MACLSSLMSWSKSTCALSFWPARETVTASNLELCFGDRLGCARLEQILGLVFQVTDVRAFGKRTVRFLRMSAWRPPFNASCPLSGNSG